MAGTKRFDVDRAIEQATAVFWTQGYGATSMDDLARVTGVTRGSLYNAFGGKEGLFLRVLDRYAERTAERWKRALDAPDPLDGIVRMFDAIAERLELPDRPRGCLVMNTCMEGAMTETAIGQRIAAHFDDIETAIYGNLVRAQAEGRLPPGQDLRALARFLEATARGLAVQHRAMADPSKIRAVAGIARAVLAAAAQGALATGPVRT